MNRSVFLMLNIAYWFVVLCSGAAAATSEESFYFGVDLSYVNEMEDCGAIYTVKRKQQDPFQIFYDHGTNLVRVRLLHNPDWTKYSKLADVKKTIRRAKKNGMEVLLDFHYSDVWADGGHQIIPKAWEHIDDVDKLAAEVYLYTYNTLLGLNEEGLMPYMVQVGNETNGEILMPDGVKNHPINWSRNSTLIRAGLKAVRDAGTRTETNPRIMLHIAQPENVEDWFEQAGKYGVTDFDIIGVSYYSKWSKYSIAELAATINRVRHRFDKEVILVETAYAWTKGWDDTSHNILGGNELLSGYPATKKGQKKYLIDLTQAIISAGGNGIVYWEPAWVSTQCKTLWGTGSTWENAALFDFGKYHKLLPSIAYMTYPYEYPKQLSFKFLKNKNGITNEATTNEVTKDTVYLWGDFLGSNKFVIPLKESNGLFEYQTSVMSGDTFRYQLFSDITLDLPLIQAKSGEPASYPQAAVAGEDLLIEHTIK